MKERLFAILAPSVAPTVKHYRGFPPETRHQSDTRALMGPARVLVVIHNPDGVFLYRYDANGACVGDTWHLSLGDAMVQAKCEYPGLADSWQEIPPEVTDFVRFAAERVTPEK